jgi:hypothetical protein
VMIPCEGSLWRAKEGANGVAHMTPGIADEAGHLTMLRLKLTSPQRFVR